MSFKDVDDLAKLYGDRRMERLGPTHAGPVFMAVVFGLALAAIFYLMSLNA